MEDAVAALEGAIDELEQARLTLPDDVGAALDDVIARARQVLERLRSDPPGG